MAHDGDLSESWGRVLCEWIDKLPADRRDEAARIVVDAARAGLGLADLLALIAEMFVRSVPRYLGGDGEDGEDGEDGQDGPGDPAEDRGVRLACDAILVPVVTGDIDVGALEDLVRLCVQMDRLDHHDQAAPPATSPARPPGMATAGPRPAPTPRVATRRPCCPAAWTAMRSGRSSARQSSATPLFFTALDRSG
jgi:hypothetical protein